MDKKKHKAATNSFKIFLLVLLGVAVLLSALSFSYLGAPYLLSVAYDSPVVLQHDEIEQVPGPVIDTKALVTHLPTPVPVHAIYMTQCVVGTPSFRKQLVEFIEGTEINSIVIDIKDYSGRIAFETSNPKLSQAVSDTCGAYDMKEFIASLHAKGIYVMGRITVFQDPYYTKAFPELGVKKASATTTLWADYKGLNFIDVGAQEYWNYIVELAKESFRLGFDELNFDYVRYPSDGDMKDIYYPWSDDQVTADPDEGKAEVLEEFFSYLHDQLSGYAVTSLDEKGQVEDITPVLSVDLFGMVTTNIDDLNIGQQLERALPYFDFVSPMTYPSHYPKNFNGWTNPNEHVYGVLKFSMDNAVRRAAATTTPVQTLTNVRIGTSTPAVYEKPAYDINKLRPWLQDFDYGKDYRAEDVADQIQGVSDAGLSSWYFWDPANRYESLRAYLKEKELTGATSSEADLAR